VLFFKTILQYTENEAMVDYRTNCVWSWIAVGYAALIEVISVIKMLKIRSIWLSVMRYSK
jgi:hypothetical protein